MALEIIQPEGLDNPRTYSHVVAATGGRLVFAAGGARPEQVAKITIYVVGHRPEYLPVIEAARRTLFGDHKPTDTLLGVQTLAAPGYLIEVDAIAVVD